MPQGETNKENEVSCCCFKKNIKKANSNCKISYSQLQESLKVPFSGDFPKNLTIGNTVCITGTINPKCTRFTIDLICRKETCSDIAFHFNPRLDRHYIVRNALVSERWGIEESASTAKCDLTRNEKFKIVYLIADDEFMVSINGRHFCSFKFRIPLKLITHLEVHGDVDIIGVKYKTCKIYPEIQSDKKSLVIHCGDVIEQVQELLTIPCTGLLPEGFEVGRQLEIYGRVKLLPHSFYINLQAGAQLWPHPIIPLHINPRFRGIAGENVVVRNAWVDGRWGPEERSPSFPFTPGTSFCIAIRKGSDNFSVWINGQLSGEFKFRGSTNNINTIHIQGDIVLKKLVLHNKFLDLPNIEREIVKL